VPLDDAREFLRRAEFLVGASPSPEAFDEPKPKARVLELVASTRFIVRSPVMEASGDPRYTG
jgi:hypothetical protein